MKSEATMTSELLPLRRSKGIVLAAMSLGILAVVCRVVFVSATDLPQADPWRHLQLVDNIRAGVGFTLFDGQPYVWYSPVWYYVAALAPSEFLQWMAAGFSLVACVFFMLFLYWRQNGDSLRGPLVGGLLMAGFGPLVAFSCQYGGEGFALALLTAALAVTVRGRGIPSSMAGGALFGLCLIVRLHFVFTGFLFLPLLRRANRTVMFGVATAIPLLAQWWHNHQVISSTPFVFTWDGLATRRETYSFLSELVPQLHVDVVEATRQLYAEILPRAQWLFDGRYRWEILLFGLIGLACLLACRRASVTVAGLSAVIYFCFLDSTHSARFFRIWLVVLPIFFVAVSDVVSHYLNARPNHRWHLIVAAFLLTLTGVTDLRPKPPVPLEAVTLPPEALPDTRYLVNSAFYHPQALIHRFPEKRFLGMPWRVEDFADFEAAYPEYRSQVWHGAFNLQTPLYDHLQAQNRFKETSVSNAMGQPYRVLTVTSRE